MIVDKASILIVFNCNIVFYKVFNVQYCVAI